MRNHLLASALVVASVFPATVSFARQSTVYASVLSTRLFVVGAPNPSTGLFFQNPPDDTLWRHSGRNNIRAFGLAVHAPSRGQLIYIASGNGAHRTTDGGASWKISTGWNITEVLGVAIDPKNPNNVYLCTAYGMFKTTDGGEHWREMNGGLSARFVSSIVIDHSNSDIVFCSTEDGVYRSDAGGRDWKRTGLNVGGVRYGTIKFDLTPLPAINKLWSGLLDKLQIFILGIGIFFNMLLLMFLFGMIIIGYWERQHVFVNLGIAFLGLYIFVRYIEFIGDLLEGATFFIVGGLLLLGLAVGLSRLRKEVLKKMQDKQASIPNQPQI